MPQQPSINFLAASSSASAAQQSQIADLSLSLLGFSLFAFIASFFIFTSDKAVSLWFYLIVLPLTLINLRKLDWSLLCRDWLVQLLMIFLGYCIISAFWAVDRRWTSSFHIFTESLHISIFFFAIFLCKQLPMPLLYRFVRLLLWIIMISAVISIAVWYAQNPFSMRLMGFFSSSQSIVSDWLYSIPVLIAMYYVIARPFDRNMVEVGLLSLPCFAYVLFTQSRGPLVAFACGIFVLLFCYRNLRSLIIFLMFVVVIFVDHTLLARSLDTFYFRESIWHTVLQQALQYPWFGHGYSASIKVYTPIGEFGHAHSAYVEIFFLGGIVGLLLQSALMLGVVYRALAHRQQPYMYMLLTIFVFGLVCLASDGNRLIVGPQELWLSFWLPLFMIISYQPEDRGFRRGEKPFALKC